MMAGTECSLLDTRDNAHESSYLKAWLSRIPIAVFGLVVTSSALFAFHSSGSFATIEKSHGMASSGASLDEEPLLFDVVKVTVDVFGMAGCPFTRGFIQGPLSEMLATVPELVTVHVVPFGNTYFVTKECGGESGGQYTKDQPFASYNNGYNATARQCWDDLCGAAADKPADDCFTGDMVCQHGVSDGLVTAAWACAKTAARDVDLDYMSFVSCTSRSFLSITSRQKFYDTVGFCAEVDGFNKTQLLECAVGNEGKEYIKAQARATVPHPGVPYVLVDGKPLQDTACVTCGDGLVNEVCKAWRAKHQPDSDVCQAVLR